MHEKPNSETIEPLGVAKTTMFAFKIKQQRPKKEFENVLKWPSPQLTSTENAFYSLKTQLNAKTCKHKQWLKVKARQSISREATQYFVMPMGDSRQSQTAKDFHSSIVDNKFNSVAFSN